MGQGVVEFQVGPGFSENRLCSGSPEMGLSELFTQLIRVRGLGFRV